MSDLVESLVSAAIGKLQSSLYFLLFVRTKFYLKIIMSIEKTFIIKNRPVNPGRKFQINISVCVCRTRSAARKFLKGQNLTYGSAVSVNQSRHAAMTWLVGLSVGKKHSGIAGRSGLAVACLTAVREVPGSNRAVGSCVHRKSHCDLQPWARAVCTLPAVPRSTQPSTLRETVNEYQLSG